MAASNITLTTENDQLEEFTHWSQPDGGKRLSPSSKERCQKTECRVSGITLDPGGLIALDPNDRGHTRCPRHATEVRQVVAETHSGRRTERNDRRSFVARTATAGIVDARVVVCARNPL